MKSADDFKTAAQIRYENFCLLWEEFKQELWRRDPSQPEKGMLKQFAEQVRATSGDEGFSAAYASHIKRKRKGIGHEVARTLELGLGKPVGWLDQNRTRGALFVGTEQVDRLVETSESPPGTNEFLSMAEQAYALDPDLSKNAMMKLLLDILSRKK